jgi:hypothetical protein
MVKILLSNSKVNLSANVVNKAAHKQHIEKDSSMKTPSGIQFQGFGNTGGVGSSPIMAQAHIKPSSAMFTIGGSILGDISFRKQEKRKQEYQI